MTVVPTLPAQGNTAWYAHYTAVDAAARRTDVYPEDFGAVAGTATGDYTTALQSALDATGFGLRLNLRGRTYRHGGTLKVKKGTSDGAQIVGGGTLLATNETACAFQIAADDVLVDNITLKMATSSARSNGAFQTQKVWIGDWNGTTSTPALRTVMRNVTSDGSVGTGFMVTCQSSGYVFDGCLVKNSKADAYHNTGGVSDGRFLNCKAENIGDDGYAIVGYNTPSAPYQHGMCNRIVFQGCHVRTTSGGRLFSALGGQDIDFLSCYGDASSSWGIIVGSETISAGSGFDTFSSNRVLMRDIEIRNANTVSSGVGGDGAVLILTQNSSSAVTNITLANVRITDTRAAATRQVSLQRGSSTGVVSGVLLDGFKFRGVGPATLYDQQYTPAAGTISRLDWQGYGLPVAT